MARMTYTTENYGLITREEIDGGNGFVHVRDPLNRIPCLKGS